MTKITATFDGLKITIEGAETVTSHQLYIASHYLALPGKHGMGDLSGEYTVVIAFNGFSLAIDATVDIEREHLLALSAEFALAAQYMFEQPRIGALVQATVQMTLQAMAEHAQNQQVMAGVRKSPGGVLTPH